MALTVEQVADKVAALKHRNFRRDEAMQDILSVRKGDISGIAPDMFPEGMPKPMVANFVDVAARDMAEVLAPLPSFNCSTSNVTSDRAKKAADRRTMIANHYVQTSKLQSQMYTGADWYLTYAFLPFVVEPDFENNIPRIRIENPLGCYPEFDKYSRLVSFTKRYIKTVRELIVDFPEYEVQILGGYGRENYDLNSQLELVRYEDKDQIMLFLPDRGNFVLTKTQNPIGRMMTVVARRPGIDPDEPRGQFDDVLWVQIARARFALLAMDAAEKSVMAPLALPNDVQEFAFGPDAILRSANPQAIRRVGLDISPAAFTEQQVLQSEMRMGSRYPEGRSGQIDASVITGQGIQALLGGFDTQIKAGQQILSEALEDVISTCFAMDELLFPGQKNVRGVHQGAPYELVYTPSTDIKGDHTVQVRYGLMSGLDPSRALIFSLQALQADLISRDFVMRELPWSMNVMSEQERIDIEKLRNALTSSIMAASQAIPQMAAAGADPSELISKIADVIDLRRGGAAVEDAVKKVFAPAPPPTVPPAAQPPMQPPAPEQAGPGAGAGQAPVGASPEGAATQAPQAAPPDIAALLAQMGA